ncbi:type II toxin-antitoxin system antitoxin SocA domain-containing protein [Mesorhizobium sp. M0187]|uniref:Panacea domain-containing protein n=1 Tax=Mesorhizobium sp. M0187 TaxID=2956908 RepID=UPI00333D79B5
MANVFDVAQFILDEQGELSAMKLQKLVYYSQAWHMVWADDQIFHNRIEAWKDGPVCPDLWREHANTFKVSHIAKGNSANLSKRERRTIKNVLKFYGKRSAQCLATSRTQKIHGLMRGAVLPPVTAAPPKSSRPQCMNIIRP